MSLDECINHNMTMRSVLSGRRVKRIKTSHRVPYLFGQIRTSLGSPKPKTIRTLFDSGSSGSLVHYKLVKKLRVKNDQSTVWKTASGTFRTTALAKVQFALLELHEQKLITYKMHMSKSQLGDYDMVIGRDLMKELGIKLNFDEEVIEWEDHSVPMKDIGASEEEADKF